MPGFSGKTLSDFCPSAERGDHGIDFWGLHTFLFLLTPLGGGDPSRTSTIWPPSRFLLTPQRRGVIQRRRGGHRRLLGISTHAPGRGRSRKNGGNGDTDQFLLTPPGGGDPSLLTMLYPYFATFLLTPPGGGDLGGAPGAGPQDAFLLTPPGGGDLL